MPSESSQRRPLRHAIRAARAASLLIPLWAVGCAVGPNYQAPDLDPPPAFANPSQLAPTRDAPAPDRWWLAFESDRLSALVEQANAKNHDLKAAFAAVNASRAAVGRNHAGLFPALDAGAAAETRDQSPAASPSSFPADDERY